MSPPECQNLWYDTMMCWCKRAKCFSLFLQCAVCVFLLPPVHIPSAELNNYSYHLEVTFPPKKLRAGYWREREIRVLPTMGEIREDTQFHSAWPSEGSRLGGQPDSEARISVYRCTKLMAMKRILPRHKSTLVFRLTYPECKLFSPFSEGVNACLLQAQAEAW